MTAAERHRRWLHKAGILVSALPYMQRYAGETLLIKLGGNALSDEAVVTQIARDVVLLKQVGIHPAIVHGGGKQIDRFMQRLSITSRRVDGLRVTDPETRDCAAMVLSSVGQSIVRRIHAAGGTALGLTGQDAHLMRVVKQSPRTDKTGHRIDLGLVGRPERVNPDLLRMLIDTEVIPVIAPTACDQEGVGYNVNADVFAGALAVALQARRLLLLTDVEGVRDAQGNLLSELEETQAQRMISQGIISEGMLPKIETCLAASREGVASVILDGRQPHILLLELFTETGAGSLIRPRPKP